MDPGDTFSAANMFKWDTRVAMVESTTHYHHHHGGLVASGGNGGGGERELEELFEGYGVRQATVSRMGELGFTATTLAGMTESELDDMITTLAHLFRWDLLVGERYGVKAAVRAYRRRLQVAFSFAANVAGENSSLAAVAAAGVVAAQQQQQRVLMHPNVVDALSQEGMSEEPAKQQEREAAGSGGEAAAVTRSKNSRGKQQRRSGSSSCRAKGKKKAKSSDNEDDGEDSEGDGESEGSGGGGGTGERQREHPFIVTEPGEVARAKKNGLDYLFHLYDQCREFLLQVQAIAKDQGHKCPTKVTNQVFRYAKIAGASYINKPKMRHYVHCYALHCLDEEASNALRREFKARGENVGAWRQACYQPLVAIASQHGWDIDVVFNAHPRLAIWYVPTKLRQMCHLARSQASAAASVAGIGALPSLPVPEPLHRPPPMY